MDCVTDPSNPQSISTVGPLSKNVNLVPEQLLQRLGGLSEPVFFYVMTTIRSEDGRLRHIGSGPNIEGGIVTLCTCKHQMRTSQAVEDWSGSWVAGFSGLKAGGGRNALFYLMRVQSAFSSHFDLWHSNSLPDEVKRAKAAHLNPLGDIFEPKADGYLDPYDPASYVQPRFDHSHFKKDGWHTDIDYVGYGNRRAALLVGDPKHTFLWDHPMLYYRPSSIGRGNRKSTLSGLLQSLKG